MTPDSASHPVGDRLTPEQVLAAEWKHGDGEVCMGCGHAEKEGHALWCKVAPLYRALAALQQRLEAAEWLLEARHNFLQRLASALAALAQEEAKHD